MTIGMISVGAENAAADVWEVDVCFSFFTSSLLFRSAICFQVGRDVMLKNTEYI